MRKTTYLLIIIFLFIPLFVSCSSKKENNFAANTDMANKGLQVYLVKANGSIYTDDETSIDAFELEDKPLFAGSDIISYNWDMHCVKIKNDGKINRELLQRRFVMLADGKRVYTGAFWSAIFSMIPPKIGIYLDNLDEKSDFLILSLGSWRPGGAISPDAEGILSDARIRKVLERDGRMYKAYKPEHFDRPDYISLYGNGSQCAYGDIDWEKKDRLLQLLDERFVHDLDYVKLALSPEDDGAMWEKEMLVVLGYEEQRELSYVIGGVSRKIACKELVMPVTGSYSELLFFRGDAGYVAGPVGMLDTFTEIDRLKNDLPRQETIAPREPEGACLVYYKGGAFQYVLHSYYELEDEDAKSVKKEAALGKILKAVPAHNPRILPLTLRFGKDDDRWFHALDDGKTLFCNGKYYHNPMLAQRILALAKEKCGFELLNASFFKGLVKAKYSFRTNTRTIERITEDKAVLAEMEKGLQKAQPDMGGGCPFSDGVLTLTFENGSEMEIAMASDDCPLMFLDGNFLKYSKELHDLFVRTFDNFPYVRN